MPLSSLVSIIILVLTKVIKVSLLYGLFFPMPFILLIINFYSNVY
jgi:hypothetical protein